MFVGGVPRTMDNDTLFGILKRDGECEPTSVTIVCDTNAPKKSKGYAFVTFADTNEMLHCMRKQKLQAIVVFFKKIRCRIVTFAYNGQKQPRFINSS